VYGTVVTICVVDRYPVVAVGPARFRHGLAALLRFSLSVSAAKMLDNLSLQSDRFLIGRYLGAASPRSLWTSLERWFRVPRCVIS